MNENNDTLTRVTGCVEWQKLQFRSCNADEQKYVDITAAFTKKIFPFAMILFGIIDVFLLVMPIVMLITSPSAGMVFAAVMCFLFFIVMIIVTIIFAVRMGGKEPLGVLRGIAQLKYTEEFEDSTTYFIQVRITGTELHTNAPCSEKEYKNISIDDEVIIVKASKGFAYTYKFEHV